MQLTHDELVEYPGFHRTTALAHVRVFEENGKLPIVIVGELYDNEGTSVTNAVEAIADVVQARYFPDGREFEYVEYYAGGYTGGDPTYDRVVFDRVQPTEHRTKYMGLITDVTTGEVVYGEALRGGFRRPKWSHLGKETVESMVGQELCEWPEPDSYTREALLSR